MAHQVILLPNKVLAAIEKMGGQSGGLNINVSGNNLEFYWWAKKQ